MVFEIKKYMENSRRKDHSGGGAGYGACLEGGSQYSARDLMVEV